MRKEGDAHVKSMAKLCVLTLAISIVVASGVAFAKSPHVGHATRPGAGKSAAPAGVVPAGVPKRYVVVNSGALSASTGTQTRGTATCPAGAVIWGGGVFVSSISLAANINSSFPSGNAWLGDVNNASGSSTTFNVYAICAKQPRTGYSVRTASFSNPVGAQTTGSVTCPAHSKPLGGGGFSSSGNTSVNINSDLPLGNGWRVDMNNASTTAASLTTYVICGKAKGRQLVSGTAVPNPSGAQTPASVSCPSPTVPVSGGAFSSLGSTSVSLNTTYPNGAGWTSYENNGSTLAGTVTSYAICAGT